MKNWKRCLSVVMTLAMLVGVLPTAAFAEEGIVPLADPIVVEDLQIAYGEGQATEFTYNGQVQVPQNIVVSSEAQKGLTADDYDLVYKKGDTEVASTTIQDAGTYTIQARLKGNYEGTSKTPLTFTIKPLAFAESAVTVTNLDSTYGDTIEPAVTCKKDDESTITLTADDYTIDYSGTDAGTQTATVTLKGNYTGEKRQAFTITAKALNAPAIEKIDDQTYTGSAITPAVVVKDGEAVIPDSQYIVSYDNNTNAGTAKASVTFSNNYTYTGEVSRTFTIDPKDISEGGSMGGLNTACNKNDRPIPTITVGEKTLVKDTDFTLVYVEGSDSLKITATGTGNYTGQLQTTLPVLANSDTTGPLITGVEDGKTYYAEQSATITDTNLDRVEVYHDGSVSTSRPADTNPTTLSVNLAFSNTPYQIKAYDKVGNVTTITVTVTKKTVTSSMITIADADNIVYDGTAKTPAITVKDGDTEIPSGQYDVEYTANTNAGTATVTVTMKGTSNYQGEATKTFTIKPKALTGDLIKLEYNTIVYTGDALTPTVTVIDGSTTLNKDTDYTVSYSNNTNPGTAKVTVTLKGNYSGTLEKTFTITPDLATLEYQIEKATEGTLDFDKKLEVLARKAAYDALSETEQATVRADLGTTWTKFMGRVDQEMYSLMNKPSRGYYTFTKGTYSNVVIKIDANFDTTTVNKIRVGANLTPVYPNDYKIERGSIVITLKSSFLRTIKDTGTYYVYIDLEDDSGYKETVTTKLYVRSASDIPQTGDPFQMTLWVGLLAVSVAGLAGFGVYEVVKKKKKAQKRLEAAMDLGDEPSDEASTNE